MYCLIRCPIIPRISVDVSFPRGTGSHTCRTCGSACSRGRLAWRGPRLTTLAYNNWKIVNISRWISAELDGRELIRRRSRIGRSKPIRANRLHIYTRNVHISDNSCFETLSSLRGSPTLPANCRSCHSESARGARARVIDATLSAEGSESTKQFCAGAAIIGRYEREKMGKQLYIEYHFHKQCKLTLSKCIFFFYFRRRASALDIDGHRSFLMACRIVSVLIIIFIMICTEHYNFH